MMSKESKREIADSPTAAWRGGWCAPGARHFQGESCLTILLLYGSKAAVGWRRRVRRVRPVLRERPRSLRPLLHRLAFGFQVYQGAVLENAKNPRLLRGSYHALRAAP